MVVESRELPNVKAIEFYGKTQLDAFAAFLAWLALKEDAAILMISINQDEEDKEIPFQVIVSYELLK